MLNCTSHISKKWGRGIIVLFLCWIAFGSSAQNITIDKNIVYKLVSCDDIDNAEKGTFKSIVLPQIAGGNQHLVQLLQEGLATKHFKPKNSGKYVVVIANDWKSIDVTSNAKKVSDTQLYFIAEIFHTSKPNWSSLMANGQTFTDCVFSVSF